MQQQGLKPKVITSSSVRSYDGRAGKWKILVGLPDPPLRGMKLHQQVSEPGGSKAVSGMQPSPNLLESRDSSPTDHLHRSGQCIGKCRMPERALQLFDEMPQ